MFQRFCILLLLLFPAAALGANPYLAMGNGALLLGQPTVRIEVYTPDDPATSNIDERVSYGPETAVLEFFEHLLILDTGANSVLLGRDPYVAAVGESNLDQMRAKGFQDAVGAYEELGVGGATQYNVSAAYHLDFAGTDGSGGTLPAVHIMSDDTQSLADYSGIVGMPAMTGRVVLLDMSPWLGTDLANMENVFLDAVPTHGNPRYHVPLTMKEFPQDGQVKPGDPLPAWAPLPFIKTYAVGSNHTAVGEFLMDTGAQLSMLSEHLAFMAGLDSDGNGALDTNDARYAGSQPITGVGGIVNVPLFNIDALVVPTAEGVDLRWQTTFMEVFDEGLGQIVETNVPLTVLVLEIAPEIDGVIGMDLLQSAWSDAAFGGTNPGPLQRIYFDFTTATPLAAEMVLDVSPAWDVTQPAPHPDLDGDGIPDDWELVYLHSTTSASGCAGSDFDGDGFCDLFEYRAGTHPTNPASLLMLTQPGPVSAGGEVAVTWQAVTGKTYLVLHGTNLAGATWSPLQAGIPGVAPLTTATVHVERASGFLGVTVEHD